MIKDALHLLLNLDSARVINERVQSQFSHLFFDGKRGLIDTEEHLASPLSRRRTFSSHNIDHFLEYYSREVGDSTPETYVNPEMMSAITYFDITWNDGSPGWGRNKAKYQARHTQEYISLIQGTERGSAFKPRELKELLIDNQAFFSFTAAQKEVDKPGESMRLAIVVQTLEKVTVAEKSEATQQHGHMSEGVSASAHTELRSADKIPEYLTVTVSPYEGFATQKYCFRLSAHPTGEARNPVRFTMTPVPDLMREASILMELAERLSAVIPATTISIGSLSKDT